MSRGQFQRKARAERRKGMRGSRHMNAAEKAALRERARAAIRKALRAVRRMADAPPEL